MSLKDLFCLRFLCCAINNFSGECILCQESHNQKWHHKDMLRYHSKLWYEMLYLFSDSLSYYSIHYFFPIFCLTEGEQSSFLFLSSFLHCVGGYCSLTCICWNIIHLCCCSVAKACLTLCDPMDCSISGFSVLHCLLEFAQTHVHWVGNDIQPSHLLSPTSPPAFNLSQHQRLFQWITQKGVFLHGNQYNYSHPLLSVDIQDNLLPQPHSKYPNPRMLKFLVYNGVVFAYNLCIPSPYTLYHL